MPAPITYQGSFDASVIAQINANFQAAGFATTGNIYYLDPYAGYDGNSGQYPSAAVKTFATGYNLLRDGKNDVLVLIENGLNTATARIDSAFTWSKNATHLVGISPATYVSQRARLAPSSGTTAFANLFSLSGSGCLFSNVQLFDGFDTGTTAQIALTVTGGRNLFQSCHIAGMGDSTSAGSATSRCVKFGAGGSENVFRKCAIGVDTVARTAANANVEFSGGCARNMFEDCIFPILATSATVLGLLTSAAAASDRFQYFNRCLFVNAVKSTGTAMTALATLAASTGGMIVLKDCTAVGVTDLFSDATTAAQMYIDGAAPTTTTTGLAVNPA